MKKFSNIANKKLGFERGARLIAYNHNGENYISEAIKAHNEGRIMYYENQLPTKKNPNGSSYLYEVKAK